MVGSVVGALASDDVGADPGARDPGTRARAGCWCWSRRPSPTCSPVRDRAPVMSLIGAVFGVAAIGGPLLGGWLAEGPGWRWTFWINLPVGGLALVAGWWLLPRRPGRCRDPPVAGARPAAGRAVPDPDVHPGRRWPVWCWAPRCSVRVGYLPTYLQLGLELSPVTSGLWMLTLAGGLAIGTADLGAGGRPHRRAPPVPGRRRRHRRRCARWAGAAGPRAGGGDRRCLSRPARPGHRLCLGGPGDHGAERGGHRPGGRGDGHERLHPGDRCAARLGLRRRHDHHPVE